MRLLNCCMIALYVWLSMWCADAHGQKQGKLPTLIECEEPTSCPSGCATKEPLSTSDEVFIATGISSNGSGLSETVTDTAGSTITTESACVGTDNVAAVQISHFIPATTGTDTITVANAGTGNPWVSICRVANASDAKDAIGCLSVSTATTLPVSGGPSVTTTVSGDFLFTVAEQLGQVYISPGPNASYGTDNNSMLAEYLVAGNAGSYQPKAFGSHSNGATGYIPVQTIAVKIPAVVATTALPDGASGVAYSAQLLGVGFTGTPACSITAGSLQTGLSLGGAGNCTISGTPSSTSTNSITFQITDGTHTATKVLSLTVGSGLNTPSIKSLQNTDFNGAGIGSSATVAASCGDVIVLLVGAGCDTHGTIGWQCSTSGTNTHIKDSFNSTVQRVDLSGGLMTGSTVGYVIGPVTQSGSDVISIKNNFAASSGLVVSIWDVSGGQGVVDQASAINDTPCSDGNSCTVTMNNTFTTPVANELSFALNCAGFVPNPVSIAAPYNAVGGNSAFGGFQCITSQALLPAAGSQTESASYGTGTAGNNLGDYSSYVLNIRPALPPACGGNFSNGDKHRRRVW